MKNFHVLIDSKTVISFDMFDTLITRNIDNPTDMFEIMENYLIHRNSNISQFKKKRIVAEKILRQRLNAKEEITLNEIYDCMSDEFNIDKNVTEELKKLEIELEENICEKNTQLWDIYQYAFYKGKKIIITTDMYLPRAVVERILEKNNIKYDKLYLSSELSMTKSNGTLFTYILNDLRIKKGDVLHIGDNCKSDYNIPKSVGIDALLVKNRLSNTVINKRDNSIEYRYLLHFISNHMDVNQGYFYNLGYQTLGPLLYGFSIWLEKKIKANNYDNVFFLSRDGLIMQKAFQIVNMDANTRYMYASRQALITPTLWMYQELSEVIQVTHFSHHMTIESFLVKMGLKSEEYTEVASKYGYELKNYIDIYNEQKKDSFQLLWKEIYGDVVANSKDEFVHMVKYFKRSSFCGKVAVVDIGWYGHMQLAIERALRAAKIDTDVDGYYVGIYPESDIQEQINMYGYICQRGKNEEMRLYKRYINSIFELTFTANHGSVKRYGTAQPEFFEYEYANTDTAVKIKTIQNGALRFVEDYMNCGLNKYMNLSEITVMKNYLQFGNMPTIEDVKMFSRFEFLDDEVRTMIPCQSRWYLIFHPRRLAKELKHSLWVTGLLKYIVHLNMNYYRLANLIRNLRYGKEIENTCKR